MAFNVAPMVQRFQGVVVYPGGKMLDVARLVLSILLLPFIIVGTFLVFWVVVVLTFLEAVVAFPLMWFASADGYFSDNTFPLEEHLADLEPHLTQMKMQKAKIHATPVAEIFPDAEKADSLEIDYLKLQRHEIKL